MSDSDLVAAEVYEAAVHRVIDALDRFSATIAEGAGMGMITTGHPLVFELRHEIQQLTLISRAVADKLDALSEAEVQAMVDRPSVDRAGRNTREDYVHDDATGDGDDDAAHV